LARKARDAEYRGRHRRYANRICLRDLSGGDALARWNIVLQLGGVLQGKRNALFGESNVSDETLADQAGGDCCFVVERKS
jgi:hypothetical protein